MGELYDFEHFEGRANLLLDHCIEAEEPGFDAERVLAYRAIAKLGLDKRPDDALKDIARINKFPGTSWMFFSLANIQMCLRFEDKYPSELLEAVRKQATGTDFSIRDGHTENHRIMLAAAGLLTAQRWPDAPGMKETHAASRAWIVNFIDRITRFGQGEFHSSTYATVYIMSLIALHEHAEDACIHELSTHCLDWLLGSMAVTWLSGVQAGAHSRDYFPELNDRQVGCAAILGWLYFGGRTPDLDAPSSEAHYLSGCALSDYRPPMEVIEAASDRSSAFEVREQHDICLAGDRPHDGNDTERVSNDLIGFGYISRRGVRRVTYIDGQVSMGSVIDGYSRDLIWTGQMRRWSVKWRNGNALSSFYLTHPFPDPPARPAFRQNALKASSPCEQVVQSGPVLAGVVEVPLEGSFNRTGRPPIDLSRFPFVLGHIPMDNLECCLWDDESPWIVLHGGTVLIGVRTSTKLHRAKINAYVVGRANGHRHAFAIEIAKTETWSKRDGTPEETASAFRTALEEQTVFDPRTHEEGPVAVDYSGLRGQPLHISFDQSRRIDGIEIGPESPGWPLIDSPHMWAEIGEGRLYLGAEPNARCIDVSSAVTRCRNGECGSR